MREGRRNEEREERTERRDKRREKTDETRERKQRREKGRREKGEEIERREKKEERREKRGKREKNERRDRPGSGPGLGRVCAGPGPGLGRARARASCGTRTARGNWPQTEAKCARKSGSPFLGPFSGPKNPPQKKATHSLLLIFCASFWARFPAPEMGTHVPPRNQPGAASHAVPPVVPGNQLRGLFFCWPVRTHYGHRKSCQLKWSGKRWEL